MAKDFLIGVGIGLVGQTAFRSAIGGSIRCIDHLGKEIKDLQASAKRIQAVRALAPQTRSRPPRGRPASRGASCGASRGTPAQVDDTLA